MIALLAKNPLASGLGFVSVILVALLGLQTMRLAWSEKETAAAALALEKYKTGVVTETLRLEREAKTKSDAKIDELALEMRSVGQVATQAKTEIRLVQSNGGPCRADPAWLATVNGVRNILAAPGSGGAGQARP
ncbi:hypothetical protein [Reyranella sp.]|uniref:hypothetical protein n=1 Tax=Reyranella sp. TaxID=1929291 RepID=UPI003F6FEC08